MFHAELNLTESIQSRQWFGSLDQSYADIEENSYLTPNYTSPVQGSMPGLNCPKIFELCSVQDSVREFMNGSSKVPENGLKRDSLTVPKASSQTSRQVLKELLTALNEFV